MKTMLKNTLVAGLALALTTFGTAQAHAAFVPVAPLVWGGVAAATVIGATVAQASAPAPYGYPPPAYYGPAPAYRYPAPYPVYAPVYGRPFAPAYYYPRRAIYAPYPFAYSFGRPGYGWGPRGGHFYHRR
jgi:hypothetical protein